MLTSPQLKVITKDQKAGHWQDSGKFKVLQKKTMKITKTLARTHSSGMFFRNTMDCFFVLCDAFVETLSGVRLNEERIARIELSTKNPKKKGFKKVIFVDFQTATLKGIQFEIVWKQRQVLADLNIQKGQSFWMKCEIA